MMKLPIFILNTVILGLLVLNPLSVSAEDKNLSSDTAKKLARAHSKEAAIHYNLGRFRQAISAYTDAYERFPAPEILFNLAQCYRKVSEFEKAIFFFEGYIREVPEAPNRQVVEELIAESKQAQKVYLKEKKETQQEAEKRHEAELELALSKQRARNRQKPIYEDPWLWAAVAGTAVASVIITAIIMSPSTETVMPSGTLGTVDRR